MPKQSFRCYFINLDRSVDRREEIEAELRAVGIEAERVAGFDGAAGYKANEIAYKPWLRNLIGSPLSPGEIGCSESHRRALRRLVESAAPFGVILEDDALLAPDFGQAIESIVAETAGWETIRLEWRKQGILADPGVSLPSGHHLVVPSNMTFGSTAMLYTRRGAMRALQSLDRGYYQTVDAHFGALCGLGFRYFQLSPPIASERVGVSLIGARPELSGAGDRKSSKRNPLQLQANSIYRAWLSASAPLLRAGQRGDAETGVHGHAGCRGQGRGCRPAGPCKRKAPVMSRVFRVVSLWLRDGDIAGFEAFERDAVRIMARHGGRIDNVVRIARPDEVCPTSDVPFEIHVVSFPDDDAFEAYAADPETEALRGRREQIISRTQVMAGRGAGPY